MAELSERVKLARGAFPTPAQMQAARRAGYEDAVANRPRAEEHDSYLDKSPRERALTLAYNVGRIRGMQQALQDRYGDLPDD